MTCQITPGLLFADDCVLYRNIYSKQEDLTSLGQWEAVLNRKFHISQISLCEELVPIRHIFHTSVSHFVKFAHVVKLYVAYMRILHIYIKNNKSAAFFNRFKFFTYMSGFNNFITWFKQIKLFKGHNEILLSGYFINYNS